MHIQIKTTLSAVAWLTAFIVLLPLASRAEERIAFHSLRDGNTEVYSMRTDGSNPLRLTTNAAFDGEPSFSADGSKILVWRRPSARWPPTVSQLVRPDGPPKGLPETVTGQPRTHRADPRGCFS